MTPYFILSIETHEELLPFINLKSHGMSSVGYCITMKEISVKLWRFYVFFLL